MGSEHLVLLPALVNHFPLRIRTPQVAESVVSLGGVPHLTTMLMSSHVRMLNEAIIALTVMAAVLGEDAVHAQGRYSTGLGTWTIDDFSGTCTCISLLQTIPTNLYLIRTPYELKRS